MTPCDFCQIREAIIKIYAIALCPRCHNALEMLRDAISETPDFETLTIEILQPQKPRRAHRGNSR